MPDDLVTDEGLNDEGEPAPGDPVGAPADLSGNEPASPAPIDSPRPDGPGQELSEGEG